MFVVKFLARKYNSLYSKARFYIAKVILGCNKSCVCSFLCLYDDLNLLHSCGVLLCARSPNFLLREKKMWEDVKTGKSVWLLKLYENVVVVILWYCNEGGFFFLECIENSYNRANYIFSNCIHLFCAKLMPP